MENPPENQKLEELIQRELDELPDREAPATLISRVLAAIEAKAQAPWWKRPWTTWPFGIRAVSLSIFLALPVLVFLGGGWLAQGFAGAVSEVTASWWTAFSLLAQVAGTLGNAVKIVCLSVNPLWLAAAFALAAVMYLSCVGLGTLCFRMVINKR